MSVIETLLPQAVEDSRLAELHRALLNLHLLLRSERLYDKNHPRRLAALEKAFDSLLAAAQRGKFEVYVRRDGLAASASISTYMQDDRGEMLALASALQQAGIKQLSFTKNLGLAELNIFVELIKVSLVAPAQTRAGLWDGNTRGSREEWWTRQLAEHAVKGILVNNQVDRKVDTLLTSLIA
ncbi:MAG: hypothetical protein ABLQ96_04725, partial [Candidatus Acidiferrum sp.]